MIEKITYIESKDSYPYQNLAVEEYLLLHCQKKQCILYLWQNKNTIVIGRNQNAWKECQVSRLEEAGGHLVRRLSGGGAVYHDLGNLNFTFLTDQENYDVERQLSVILLAVNKLGIKAEKSGRNDILVDGKKFSGNAFYRQAEHCYHHGTLMVDVNLAELSKYLTVSKEKLSSKGVASVKSRVINLREFAPGLTIEELKKSLLEAFQEVYGQKADILKMEDLDEKELENAAKKFASWGWTYGRRMDFQHELSRHFKWGQVDVRLNVKDGRIEEAAVFSDSMKPDLMLELPRYLKGCHYDKRSISIELGLYWSADPDEDAMMKDIIAWIESIDF